MSYQPNLTEGVAVAGISPPLGGSGGSGWMSAIWLEMRALRQLLERQLIEPLEMDNDLKEEEEDL